MKIKFDTENIMNKELDIYCEKINKLKALNLKYYTKFRN